MEFTTRNTTLFNKVKDVYLKPLSGSGLEVFSKLYSTFSKTKFSVSSKFTASGILYNVKLDCFYPGYNRDNLSAIHSFLKDQYAIKLQLTDDSEIEIATKDEPLDVFANQDIVDTKFSFTGSRITPISPTVINSESSTNNSFPYQFPIKF